MLLGLYADLLAIGDFWHRSTHCGHNHRSIIIEVVQLNVLPYRFSLEVLL